MALVLALVALAENPGPAFVKPPEKRPSRFTEQRKAEAEAKRRRKAAKRGRLIDQQAKPEVR
ncbi:hypothetical protein RT95_20785 [Xanthomonas campestris]|nr:hypothetical protein RT95_20785 [Xanthomonas campestris]